MPIKLANSQGFESHEALCEAAVDRIVALVEKNPKAVIGLATGGTMEPLYAALVKRYQERKSTDKPLSFKEVTFFTLDEYVNLPREHPQSYHSYLHRHLLDHIDVQEKNINIPNGNAPDAAAECQRYEDKIRDAGGVDLWLAGIGPNGHVAFNEPGSRIFDRTRKITLSESTREANKRFFDNDINKVPKEAITVGLATLKEHAREVLLLANGPAKAAPMAAVLRGSYRVDLPASVLSTMNTTVFADRLALAQHQQEAGRAASR